MISLGRDDEKRDGLTGDARTAELSHRLDAVRRRIEAAVAAAGRTDPPRLIVVTKFHPADDVRRLAALGVTDVGENRDQEAAAKSAGLPDVGVRWHFIGQLQSNKAKSVVKYAASVQSIERLQVVDALAKAVAREQDATGRSDLDCFIQVGLDDDAGAHRGGASPSDIGVLADRIEHSKRDLGAAVHYYGRYAQADVAQCYATFECLVFPSVWWENAPLVLHEALHHRRDIIAYPHGGGAEILRRHGKGVLAEQSNPLSLSFAMEKAALAALARRHGSVAHA